MNPLVYSFGSFFQFKYIKIFDGIMWNIFKYSTKLNNSVTLKENLPEICPFFCMPKLGWGRGGGAAQNVLQTVLKADLPQNFYVYMYLNIKFVGQFFHFHMTKKCGKVVQNFALFRLSDFCNWTLVKRGSVKKYNQRWR